MDEHHWSRGYTLIYNLEDGGVNAIFFHTGSKSLVGVEVSGDLVTRRNIQGSTFPFPNPVVLLQNNSNSEYNTWLYL